MTTQSPIIPLPLLVYARLAGLISFELSRLRKRYPHIARVRPQVLYVEAVIAICGDDYEWEATRRIEKIEVFLHKRGLQSGLTAGAPEFDEQ